VNASKQEIRDAMRKRRRSLSPGEQRHHAAQLALHVACRQWFRSARHVALYLATDGEIDLEPVARLCWRTGKAVYLPRIDSDGMMRFARFNRGDRRAWHKFGIQQPLSNARVIDPERLDIVFVPLVAFSSGGLRLGMGGGYYDRTFAGCRGDHLVGVAHSCQREEQLPRDDWDVPMARILTEKGAVRPPREK
jgi:5-formyltetrahydrofolate cyclo-ligase